MPKEVPCAGPCGRTIYLGRGSLPAGQATCRTCRAEHRSERVATCAACGAEFPCQGEATYCSDTCRESTRDRSRHRACEVCSAPYVATYTDQRTCGRECGALVHARHQRLRRWPSCRIYAGYCQLCSSAFTSRGKRRTCSRYCADRLYNVTARPSPTEHECADCGLVICNRRKKCDPCLAKSRAARRLQDKRRRRAVKLGVASEPYTIVLIAVRDRHRCGLCRKRVDMALKVPHPQAPTIDHVVPLSVGGDDTRANVQLAHFLCNSRKSDGGGGEQLALVG